MDAAHVFCQVGKDESNCCRQLSQVLDGFLRGDGDNLREEGDVQAQDDDEQVQGPVESRIIKRKLILRAPSLRSPIMHS